MTGVNGGAWAGVVAATCSTCGKRCYSTRKFARQAARDFHPGEAMRAYRCGANWHIGHRTPRRERTANAAATTGPRVTTGTDVRDAILRHGYRWNDEYQLQQQIATVLQAAGIPAVREHVLPGAGRPDFWIDGVVIEVKVQGSVTNVLRQLGRYAAHDDVTAIVLATGVGRLLRMPEEIDGVPIILAPLFGALL